MFEMGKIAGSGYEVRIPDTVINHHISYWGESGSGKTKTMKETEKRMIKANHRVLILNYGGTHDDVLLDATNYHVVRVKENGIPIPLLECFSSSTDAIEDSSDVCESVMEVFTQGARLGYVLQNLLRKACEKALMTREMYEDDMECLYSAIVSLDEDEKVALTAKYYNVFKRVKFQKKFNLWSRGKATILDFSGYPQSTQLLISQLVLSVLWRYHRIYGQQMKMETWIALDEFQNFPLKNGSLLTQILREGRKYKLSLLLATQTLSSFDVSQRVILQQMGTKLYFRPAEADLKKIAKSFPDIEVEDAENILRNLKVGECMADGEFEIEGKIKRRTLKISFRECD